MATIPLLFITFFEIGLFTIGGGYAMIPLMQEEVVGHGWMTLQELIDFIAIAESTPGPFAVNVATFVGMDQAGILGAIFATLGVVLPSFLIILLIAKFFGNFKDNFFVKSALTGLRPAVVGLLAFALFTIFRNAIFDLNATAFLEKIDFRAVLLLVAIGFMRYKFKKVHPGIVILVSAALGIIVYSAFPG